MGTFHSTFAIAATAAGPFESIEALVDSGATYTLVPAAALNRLGVAPTDRQTCVLADGSRVERDVGEAVIRIDERTRTAVVIFGDEDAEPLLGAVTLEEFGLGIDTLRRELVPVPGYLVGIRLGDAHDS
jgi:clan AA aspartic protease